MNVPDEAVEAASKALYELQVGQVWGDKPEYAAVWEGYATAALEAAAPHLLSHERQQTADAHRDAIVNRDTVDRLEKELQRAKAQAWDEGWDAFADFDPRPSGPYPPNPYRHAGAGE